ncbi:1-acyl-sn-glycerol-3-phosphate acyltransferase [Rhodobium orientis]|uniref:1-acyl-sn-glycerol-3-phosphate acyltransferase n=1 Tax=Rhodobium orientis TaxID=34017 RepID=A0A327JS35_9HYPH|nr:lysophospholipid acyltransferase family protein [Rhodobium orientis]MBB4304506.1 1-acyl-sn-glycerol-3-phosphate acyltransferase [Rhodobium orientis]MBK5948097.1 1-acyl-sn-glycerol-3-phosphate acyltransferase [Rhodobium orientis]RAI26178.1 1-acyl-sn-glycerol-3-phosphate acyltransferase [Rhodobium orientis]
MGTLRAVFILSVLTPVTLLAIPVQWLAVRTGSSLARRIPVAWHRFVRTLLGIRVRVTGRPSDERPLLITANHASWLDITVLSGLMPISFIAKAEVAGWPVFGLFAKLQRTVFVDRTRRAQTGVVATEIAGRLKDGDAMVLFPEGTSNNGNEVLPFRTALIGAARHAIDEEGGTTVWIQPLSIAYTRLHGVPLGRRYRPLVAWYGGMDMAPHFLAVLKAGPLDVEITWGEPIGYDVDSDRKAIARTAEKAVREMTTAALTGRQGEAAVKAPPKDVPMMKEAS